MTFTDWYVSLFTERLTEREIHIGEIAWNVQEKEIKKLMKEIADLRNEIGRLKESMNN